MTLEPRRCVERVSFLTSPGYISGPSARSKAGLRPQGPNLVVSSMGVFDFDTTDGGASGSCELRLAKLFPGIDADVVQALIPWPLALADSSRWHRRPTTAAAFSGVSISAALPARRPILTQQPRPMWVASVENASATAGQRHVGAIGTTRQTFCATQLIGAPQSTVDEVRCFCKADTCPWTS